MNTHTKGPWKIEAGGEYRIVDENNQTILLIGDTRRLIPCKADGLLIAAAPALLAALETLVDHAQELHPHFESARGGRDIEAALKAIQLATGKGEQL